MKERLRLCSIPGNQSNKSSIFHGSNQSISCIHWNFTFKRLVKFMELEYAHYIKWLQRRPILAHNAHSGPWWNVFAMCHTILVARFVFSIIIMVMKTIYIVNFWIFLFFGGLLPLWSNLSLLKIAQRPIWMDKRPLWLALRSLWLALRPL